MVMRLLLLAAPLVGCTDVPEQYQILDSPVVPFSELFAPADTIHLDPSIIVGQISFLDVNQEGNFLVTDGVGRSVDLFSSSGKHIRTYSVPECLPDVGNFHPYSSRFMGKGYVVTMTWQGSVVVFSTDGHCVGATRRLPDPSLGFCPSGDSIFFLSLPLPMREAKKHNTIVVYSPELHRLREIPVEQPKFPALNVGRLGIRGRNIDCFGDGPYYTYLGSMDAVPVHFGAELTQQRAEFYEDRPRDISPKKMSDEEETAEWNRYITTDAVFALDNQTRMVMYRNLDDQWQPAGLKDARIRRGISVASNVGQFPPRSTIFSFVPIAAGYGYTYGRGANELLSDGDVGNPFILRYRFIPPQGTNE